MDYFKADRCYYCELIGDEAIIRRDASRGDLPSVAGIYRMSDFPIFQAVIDACRPFTVENVHTTDLLDEPLRQLCIQLQLESFVDVPVIKNGEPVGILCITQCMRREWTDFEIDLGREIADRAWQAVERAQAAERLRESEQFLNESQRIAKMGSWRLDLLTNKADWSENCYRLYGFEPNEVEPTFERFKRAVHPDDLHLVEEIFSDLLQNPRTASQELRIFDKNGRMKWVYNNMTPTVTGGQIVQLTGVQVDITERKQADEKLRESEQRFTTIFKNSPVAIGISHLRDGQIVQVNSAFVNFYGFSCEEIIGHTTAELGIWANLADRQHFIEALNAHQHINGLEATARLKSGAERQVLVWGELVEINGEPCLMAQVIDITERKRAEQKLRASEEKYRGLMETLDSVVATIDNDGKFLFMNDVAAAWLGGTPQTLIGKTLQELFPITVASQQLAGVRRVIREDRGHVSEDLTFVQGKPRWFHNSLQPIHDEHGQVAHVLLHATDIHDLKSTQQELAELNRTLEERIRKATAEIQDLYENAPAGYHSLDANGCFVQINQTELNWLGYSREEVIGQPFADFVTPDGLVTFRQNFPGFKQHGWLQDLEMEFLRKDGTSFLALVNATAINDENGNYLMSRSTVFDITERKQAEEALRESRDRLDRANRELAHASRAKDEFLANMSHELRTPLNGIMGISEILLLGNRGPLNERQRAYVSTIDASGRYLLNLINDVLDLSKIEADKLELQREAVSIRDVCQASLTFIREPAIAKGLTVGFEIDETLTTLQADARRLKQILVNLLGNAVKFTPAGGRVTLEVRPNRERRFVEFSVSDTGIGISAGDQQRLFNPFIQVDSGLTRSYEGTGLGLVLVKRLAELHGGHVSLTSELGLGSRFTVSLPWEETVPTPAVPADTSKVSEETPGRADQKSKATILLAEDNPTNVMVIADYLDIKGYSVVIAGDGFEALEKAAQCAPDLILMDIQMPRMDGLEAIRRLRADPQFASTPIIAVTAHAMSGDRERCLEAGATDYMSKPVVLVKLMELVTKLLA